MKHLVIALCLIPGLASAAVAGGGAAAAGMMAVGAAARSDAARRSEAAKHPADCAACHEELFPFRTPTSGGRFSDPIDRWRGRTVGDSIIMTREVGKVRRIYLLRTKYGPIRVFLPATDGTKNPHHVLEEQ